MGAEAPQHGSLRLSAQTATWFLTFLAGATSCCCLIPLSGPILFSEALPFPDFHHLALYVGICVHWFTLPLEVDGFSHLDQHYGFSTFCPLIPVPFWLLPAYVAFESPTLSLTLPSVFQPGLINVLLCHTGTMRSTLTHDYLSR